MMNDDAWFALLREQFFAELREAENNFEESSKSGEEVAEEEAMRWN